MPILKTKKTIQIPLKFVKMAKLVIIAEYL